ncbi:AGAP004899-PA [Anopheles gambiae str. PEST]|uniref:AGAP004899-PA n=1 Tax=Anopheles gambiae TaxID=7165 RepID=A0NE72_ANOGA|nr:AGAP004899-PA [Anopheles gambiae str. PEST]
MIVLQVVVIMLLTSRKSANCQSVVNHNNESVNLSTQNDWRCARLLNHCLIVTIVNYRVPGKEFAINFDCNVHPVKNAHSDKVFRKVTSYRMDGRNAYSDTGFGLEYLSFPDKITTLVLHGYCVRMQRAVPLYRDFHNLELLELINCNVNHINGDVFQDLPKLQKLVLNSSTFGVMTHDVFHKLIQLKEMFIENCTGIQFTASDLVNIQLIAVRNSTVYQISSIFDYLPSTLKTINFVNVLTHEIPNVTLRSSDEEQSAVEDVAVVQSLLSCVIVKSLPRLISLNLSRNSLSENSIVLHNLPSLVTLVLSHNGFNQVSVALFASGSSLNVLDLSHNQISYIHPKAFSSSPLLRMVNLSYNLLLSMENLAPLPRLERIEIDKNPWDCLWLTKCRVINPSLFEIFRYSKRYDVLSVWGLPCRLEDTKVISTSPPFDRSEETIADSVSAYPQGKIFIKGRKESIVQPLSTATNSLKILITISVGVLVSNVIILLYNRYRKILHVPFYRYLTKTNSIGDAGTEKSTSFWYEVPVGGDPNAMPLNNIYEEICDSDTRRDLYDALNFHQAQEQ